MYSRDNSDLDSSADVPELDACSDEVTDVVEDKLHRVGRGDHEHDVHDTVITVSRRV